MKNIFYTFGCNKKWQKTNANKQMLHFFAAAVVLAKNMWVLSFLFFEGIYLNIEWSATFLFSHKTFSKYENRYTYHTLLGIYIRSKKWGDLSLCIHELVLSFIYILILLHIWKTCFELLKDKAFPRQHNFLLSMSKNLSRIWNTNVFLQQCVWILKMAYFLQNPVDKKLKLMYLGSVYISNIKRHNMAQLSLDHAIKFFIKYF